MTLLGSRVFASGFAVAVWACVLVGCARPEFVLAGTSAEDPSIGTTEEDVSEGLDAQVVRLYQEGRFAEAIPLATHSLEQRERALGPEHPDVATSLNIAAGTGA